MIFFTDWCPPEVFSGASSSTYGIKMIVSGVMLAEAVCTAGAFAQIEGRPCIRSRDIFEE